MMSTTAARQRHFGNGPLSQGAALVYTLLVVEVLVLLTSLPGLVPLVLLSADSSNLPLAAACALPLGPAVSAALYALRHRSGDITDLHPANAFFRGYRLNFLSSLKIWVPGLAWLTVIGLNLANFGSADVPGWWAGLLIAIAIAVALWVGNALVITSLFTFRTIDVARLAVLFLARTPAVTLGNACLVVLAALLTAATSEVVLVMLGSVFALVYLLTSRRMITAIREEFTA
ncbi:DUF624 domain-containing protein [Phytohabitans houttuyneae]|uniref:DUF624 domain-containing protein n=1 Tax=Phytohabitans houttuyneae TaxID=1076126 RepID=A0A6V8KHQ9_9ACTN|nr:DUF624 domain-containing protein [Phytohabitans houttuyneae]GFJ84742.1 hypothetical protein Phou_089220 [Phytohabitans houttuyneae]